ncbi:MAG: PKD domain-containing protein, partial [Bacteroidales bacterium]|nr:PKD domain-containing protein [Bacteroidales bacterium]
KTSDGFSWDNISNGIINSQMYKLSVSQTESNSTITGLQDNGTKLLYTDGNWYDVKGGDGMECLIDYSDYNVQYGTYVYGQITRTIDGWSGDYTDIEPSGAGDGAWVTPYIIHPSTPTTLYAGYSDVWKTTNRGNSWTQISNINSSDKIRSMAISASNPQVLYVADRTHIWKTTNEGTSWTDVTNNLPSSSITYIAIKNDDPNTVWVTLGSYNADAIYLSTNGGSSWSNISTGIPNIPTNCIIQNTQNTGETELYAGTDFGVYLKRGNNNWELFNTGMPKVVVGELDIYYDANPNNSKLRAATYGRGLWESDLYSAASTTPPVADFSADQTSICSGENINFTDLSSNTPTSWTWSITPSTGVTYTGGTDANSQNPVITFAQAGTYTVALSATNGAGFDNETKVDFITVNASPAVDFSADQTSISFGETIGFTDLSSESPSSWEWVFSNGNPAISYSQNPMVTYNIPGTFDVTLTATLNGCSNSLTKVDYITVSNQIVSCLGNFYDSGGENGNYANLEDLSWLIQSDIGENLYMTFDTIRLESGYDYLYIYDGIDDSAPLTGTYSGNYGPFTINSTNSSNYLYIKFHSDASVTDLGWDAHYFCNDFILSPEAEFSANETTICSGENINFTDLSSNTPTSWTWSITPSTGVTYTGGTDANSQNPIITFTQAGTYTVALTATNEGGFDTETKTNYITVIGTPESPDAIVGNTDVCQLTQQNFSTNYISGYTYNWTFPTDWSGGSTTNSIDLTIGAESGTVSVTASNTCGMSPAQILEISVIESPNNLTSISGNETLCSNSQSTYSVSAINNAVYYWTLPNGWTGSSSTNNISVTANDQSGTISVYAENSCGTSSTENINIDVVAGTPSQPSPIIGANPVCINAITNYSVNNISGITYFWSLPSGWSGSGHTSGIDVNVGNTGGVITVTPFNACGMGISRTLNVSVNQAITSVSSINGLSEVCENQSLTYQVTAQNATQFVWALPSGWTGNSTTNNIHPTAGTNSGNIEVTPTNACGNGPAASISVVVNMLPTAYFSHSNQGLVVDFIDNSNLANTYNWNFGDGTTSSEQNPTHNYTNSGTYTATLTVSNDCGSDTYYTTINVTNVGINIQANEDWKIYPNPTQSYLNIEGLSLHKKYTVKITDVSGRIVLINEDLLKTNVLSFDLNHLINGSYFIEIQQDNTIKQYKFVKN